MALTLAEGAKLSNDMVKTGVVESIISVSPILERLPFTSVEGNAYKYNRESTLGTTSFFAVDGVWTESSSTFSQQTATLAILGGDADVDNFIERTRSNLQDQRAVQTILKAKSLARKFEDTFLNGSVAVDPNAFDGLAVQVAALPAAQTISAGANGGALTLPLADQVIDAVLSGPPDMHLMARRTRRKLKSLLTASTHYVERGENSFGRQVMMYDGIPVEASDYQSIAETQGSESAASSWYSLRLNEIDGICGIQNGDVEVIDVGQLQTKDATRVRLRWYVSIVILSDKTVGRIIGINAS